MPWFYRHRCKFQTVAHTDTRQCILLLILLCCAEKCCAFSPHLSKQLSLLHASTSETKTATLEVESRHGKPILSSEVRPKLREQFNKRVNKGQQSGCRHETPRHRKPRQRCSKAQNAKRKIRFLYSKAR